MSAVSSSSVIGIGGLGLHPFRLLATSVFVSLWMSFTWSPSVPVTSLGLSPVSPIIIIFMLRGSLAVAIRNFTLSSFGGCMPLSSVL